MSNQVFEAANGRKNLTATGVVSSATAVMGVFVSQASAAPTIKVADVGGTIANTFTPQAGQYYAFPCKTRGDITVTIGGTVDCTVFYS